jgi:hypothetical protein
MTGLERLAVMLQGLGADVRTFTSLPEAAGATVPTGMTVLVVRLALTDDDEQEVDPVTFVVKGFGVLGVLHPEPLRPSFVDRFVEVHQGKPEASRLCASIIRAAGLSQGHLLPRQANGRQLPIAS